MSISKAILEGLGLQPINKTLYKQPIKDKGDNMPHYYQITKPNLVCQVDLLYLPVQEDGYQYALIAVDVGSRKCDAEPCKDKESATMLEAIKTIFKRGIVKEPKIRLECDPGTEFKGAFKEYFEEKENFHLRYGKVGRHRQQAIAEHRNQLIGKLIHMRLTQLEEIHVQNINQWTDILPDIIKLINNNIKTPDYSKLKDKVMCKGDACNLLNENTKVRVILDEPKQSLTGEKLYGKFRSGDARWKADTDKIDQVLIRPNGPPMYTIKGDNTHTAYTKNQLQVVGNNEEPDAEKLKYQTNDNTTYRVHKILDRRKRNNKYEYLIRWYGYPDPKHNTWVPRANLKRELWQEYDNSLNA